MLHASETGEARPSPFFHTPTVAEDNGLAILHLKRDSLVPVTLRSHAPEQGYADRCAVSNTRFGSFPHNTLIGLEWGSQVRASRVDTGTRGRRGKNVKPQQSEGQVLEQLKGQKRNSVEAELDNGPEGSVKKAKATEDPVDAATATATPPAARAPVDAGSGFIHILPPTPEGWTYSLDHRTQVVYTPDYSYILQRLRVKPGDVLIEAGAGSGSFTHAAARAVFNGPSSSSSSAPSRATTKNPGKIYSYEYHAPRVETLRQELSDHRLDDMVHLTHRDVCSEGFLHADSASPKATAIFLDLPAPHQALRHLTRSSPSALDPEREVHLCTFSPCIEQVQATASFLRRSGWTAIHCMEIAHRRIDVRREQVGLKNEGLRGVNASPASVEEAVGRLREVEGRMGEWAVAVRNGTASTEPPAAASAGTPAAHAPTSKAARLAKLKKEAEGRKTWLEGRLVHRTEPEVKSHTSYLTFATLPREWREEDERMAAERWSVEGLMRGPRKTEGAEGEGGKKGKKKRRG